MKIVCRLLFVSLFIICNTPLFSQSKADCKIILTLLKSKKVRDVFLIDKHPGLPIRFKDKQVLFQQCNLRKFHNREILFETNVKLLNEKDPANIGLTSMTVKKNVYHLDVYQKYSGAFGYIEFKKKDGDYFISNIHIGYF